MDKKFFTFTSSRQLIKRFIVGILTGIFLAFIYWSYSSYFHVDLSLAQGIMGSLLLAIACGVIATFSGLDKLIDNLPSL